MARTRPASHLIQIVAAATLGDGVVVEPVDEFGWVKRDAPAGEGLRAEVPTEREFMVADLDRSLSVIGSSTLGTSYIYLIRDIIRSEVLLLDALEAHLAHGDFDVTHIYCHQGQYTGIIDLGDIRGTGSYYDLGHFRFHGGETLPGMALPYLLEGYREITPLPSDADRRITLASLLIGVHFLARTHTRLTERTRRHAIAAIAAIARDVTFITA